MRVLLFTGKGGVGKTTAAAATAAFSASTGHKTLVLSTDSAHSLADALDVKPSAEPRECAAGLFFQQVERRLEGGDGWAAVRGYLRELVVASGLDALVVEEVATLPGAEELRALVELRDQVVSGRWDAVIVDCAPTAETLRLLALPDVLDALVGRVFPTERFVARALRPLLSPAVGLPLPPGDVIDAVQNLRQQIHGIQEVLAWQDTSVRLVLTPESLSIAEARRTYTALSLYGYRVDSVIANKVIPDSDDSWMRSWAAAQEQQLREISESFAPLPILQVKYGAREPVGVEALLTLATELYGELDPLAGATSNSSTLKLQEQDGQFEMVIALPLAEPADITLQRRGDELLVEAGASRRVIALPAGLKRCAVSGARFESDALTVRFEPDERQWPTGRL